MNNTEEYKKAKNESEPLCIDALNCPNKRFEIAVKGNIEQDKCLHIDIVVYDNIERVFACIDVKHVNVDNIKSKNYSLSSHFKDFFERHPSKNHWLAFRLTDDEKMLDEFLCAKTLDVLNQCSLKKETNKKTDKSYFLVNIDDVKQNCKDIVLLKLDY